MNARYRIASLGLVALFLQACATHRDLTNDIDYTFGLKRGEVVVTTMDCYVIHYANGLSIRPVDGRYLAEPFTYEDYRAGKARGFDAERVIGVLTRGSRISFQRVFSWSAYMTDTHIEYEGTIADGKFKGRKANINALLLADYDVRPRSLKETYVVRSSR